MCSFTRMRRSNLVRLGNRELLERKGLLLVNVVMVRLAISTKRFCLTSFSTWGTITAVMANWAWPEINDEDSARDAAHIAGGWAGVVAGVTTLLAAVSIFGGVS